MQFLAIRTLSRMCFPVIKANWLPSIMSRSTFSSQFEIILEIILYGPVTMLVGRYIDIRFAPFFFGIKEINVELQGSTNFPWLWNSSITFTKSSFIISQHSWKNAIVKLSGLGPCPSLKKRPPVWFLPTKKVFPVIMLSLDPMFAFLRTKHFSWVSLSKDPESS